MAVEMRWRGKQSEALLDTTHALDIEGAIRASKTTICLWKEHDAVVNHPGIHTLLARWTDDATDTLLRPLWSEILNVSQLEGNVSWSAEEHCYKFTNGSRAYMLGLKAPDELRRYSKFRGLTLARAYIDQAEELPEDVFRELKGRLSQRHFPRQIVISPNAVGNDHWIAKEFPADNHLPGRKYIPLSVYDNSHNLDPAYLSELEATYPEGHPKRRTLILGMRGLNVIGRRSIATTETPRAADSRSDSAALRSDRFRQAASVLDHRATPVQRRLGALGRHPGTQPLPR
jgi:hypothetical protein